MADVEELHRFSKPLKEKKKTRLSNEEHESAIELLKNSVLDREADFTGVLEAMDSMPSVVIGDLTGIVWDEIFPKNAEFCSCGGRLAVMVKRACGGWHLSVPHY